MRMREVVVSTGWEGGEDRAWVMVATRGRVRGGGRAWLGGRSKTIGHYGGFWFCGVRIYCRAASRLNCLFCGDRATGWVQEEFSVGCARGRWRGLRVVGARGW